MMQLREKKKIALVLSGGGIKAAAYHIGVCLALQEKGFKFAGGPIESPDGRKQEHDPMTIRLYVGSSAGAFVSSVLAAGYSPEALISAFEIGAGMKRVTFAGPTKSKMKPIAYRDLFALNGGNFMKFVPNVLRRKSIVTGGLEALVKNGFKINGLFTTKGIERYLRKNVLYDNDFSRLGVELFIIGTQLNHTNKVIFGDFPETTERRNTKLVNYATISEAVAASTSLPPVYAPYGIVESPGNESFFFDGEIRDTLSTHVAADHGADLVISSYSTQPYHYNKEMGSLHHYGIPVIINQALYQVIQQKIVKHIEHQSTISAIHSAVDGYFKQTGLPDEHRLRLLKVIEERANFSPEVDYMYIHPKPQNHEMFFVDHFSLNPDILARIVGIGFKSAISVLRRHNL